MVSFNELIQEIYEIQGASDPNHIQESLVERMAEIFERASRMMEKSGYQPPEV